MTLHIGVASGSINPIDFSRIYKQCKVAGSKFYSLKLKWIGIQVLNMVHWDRYSTL